MISGTVPGHNTKIRHEIPQFLCVLVTLFDIYNSPPAFLCTKYRRIAMIHHSTPRGACFYTLIISEALCLLLSAALGSPSAPTVFFALPAAHAAGCIPSSARNIAIVIQRNMILCFRELHIIIIQFENFRNRDLLRAPVRTIMAAVQPIVFALRSNDTT